MSKRKSIRLAPVTPYEIVLVSLAALFPLGAFIWWKSAGLDVAEGIGAIGTGFSIAGVILAVMIFTNQKRRADESEKRILGAVAAGEKMSLEQAVNDVFEEGNADPFEEETALIEALGDPAGAGGQVLRLNKDDVPLQLVRDLVLGWEQSGMNGQWSVGDLVSVMRRRGKGNHAWWFTFIHPKTDQVRTFRMSRGGRGKGPDELTVTDSTIDG